MIYIKASRYCLRVLLCVVFKGLGAFRSGKIRGVFNESLNELRIALNIMNEGKNEYLLHSILKKFKKFAFESNP